MRALYHVNLLSLGLLAGLWFFSAVPAASAADYPAPGGLDAIGRNQGAQLPMPTPQDLEPALQGPGDDAAPAAPLDLYALQNLPKENTVAENVSGLKFDIRADAVREAAISFGARGGLSWRTYHIRQELEKRAPYLDKVFDFSRLLIPAPSGLLIEPPIINESIELAKGYGGTDGHKYVNGVLDRLAAKLRPAEVAARRAARGRSR